MFTKRNEREKKNKYRLTFSSRLDYSSEDYSNFDIIFKSDTGKKGDYIMYTSLSFVHISIVILFT